MADEYFGRSDTLERILNRSQALVQQPEVSLDVHCTDAPSEPSSSSSIWQKYAINIVWKKGIGNKQFWKDYAIDVTVSWMFFTTTMAAVELGIGLEADEVAGIRKGGIVAGAITMRPYELLRTHLAKRWGVTEQSPYWRRLGVELTTMITISIPTYTAMLYTADVWSEKSILPSIANPLASLLLAAPFGYVKEKWAKLWGRETVLYK